MILWPIIMALVLFTAGITLYILGVYRKIPGIQAINYVLWLGLALFPVIILYILFPDVSKLTLKVKGLTATGAVGCYLVIYWFGTKKTNQKLVDIENFRKVSKPIGRREEFSYTLKGNEGKKVALITGDILKVKGIDIWVNSENTNMQMARFHDNSISGVTRYFGAKRDNAGNVLDDIIANELEKQLEGNSFVQQASVFVTTAGELKESNDVKKIFHVAAVEGEAGSGYQPIRNIGRCVSNALKRVDGKFKQEGYKSILFPLLGTGTAKGELENISEVLIHNAISYFEDNPNTTLESIYFLVWTERELEVCKKILAKDKDVKAVR